MPWYQPLFNRWPDLAVTFLAVLFGAFFAWLIESKVARWQVTRQEETESLRNQELLLAHINRVKVEVRDNEQTVGQLLRLLDEARGTNEWARKNLLQWANKLASGLSVAAYESMVESGLQRIMPAEVQQDLFDARQRTINLQHMIDAGETALQFYLFGGGTQADRDLLFDNIRTYSHTTHDGLKRVKDAAYRYAEELTSKLITPPPNRVTEEMTNYQRTILGIAACLVALRLFFPMNSLAGLRPDYAATLMQALGILVLTGALFLLAPIAIAPKNHAVVTATVVLTALIIGRLHSPAQFAPRWTRAGQFVLEPTWYDRVLMTLGIYSPRDSGWVAEPDWGTTLLHVAAMVVLGAVYVWWAGRKERV